ncbi:GspH/FimT family pseudopilin [Acinetobacter haemolyticus]|uniref:Type II secretion system protein H n=1 Tax=Acinetobacter haemolyticus TaxID=29430 RepID=A0A4P7B1U6_ACIHA|nr:GspH/FimT family pseudopilin [Acinetobacter haemolyticus]QBQ15054.1 prepilin-type N-terminal cleavage/methylation domain-containing protein [Acinetobacter haemolyticus]
MQQAKYKAFTLIELIVTIAILAIIAVMAAPSFADMITRKKLESAAREVVMRVSEARSQAVLLRQTTGVCLGSLSADDCATAIEIPKTETQRTFVAQLKNGITAVTSSPYKTSLIFRKNGSVAASTNFQLKRKGICYYINVGITNDTTIKEGTCT